jgi:hypothetical protein
MELRPDYLDRAVKSYFTALGKAADAASRAARRTGNSSQARQSTVDNARSEYTDVAPATHEHAGQPQ